MASASCSSTCIPALPNPCGGASRCQFFYHGKTSQSLSIGKKEKKLGFSWKEVIRIPESWSLAILKTVATVEPECSISIDSGNGNGFDSNSLLVSDSESPVVQSPSDGSLEVDEKEKLRRFRISKANRGNVPWNLGRKHSPETLRLIRERTRIAMQDPKVKMKLVNLGHAQSEETRIKIAVGVREGWQRRRQRLMVQERCFHEWQNLIAEAAREGYAGEDELQWDSYTILDEKLTEEWLQSIELRKNARPKGSKRAPKSLEQRRKISEAISAKWADPDYRQRVCGALSKYHGTSIVAERRPRRKTTSETPRFKRENDKKYIQLKGLDSGKKSMKKVKSKKRRNATPSYADPMASSKLEMIKQIREKRAALETRKREATERAKLLIAEAEKAANALELAALKSPLAQASLLETRQLIAQATRSIQSIESGQLMGQDNGDDESPRAGGPVEWNQSNPEIPSSKSCLNGRPVNGTHLFSKSKSNYNNLDHEKVTFEDDLNASEPLPIAVANDSPEVLHYCLSPSLEVSDTREKLDMSDTQVGLTKINGFTTYQNLPPELKKGDASSEEKTVESPMISTTRTKKWVCGKLTEVD